jgi:hypothetical protein
LVWLLLVLDVLLFGLQLCIWRKQSEFMLLTVSCTTAAAAVVGHG